METASADTVARAQRDRSSLEQCEPTSHCTPGIDHDVKGRRVVVGRNTPLVSGNTRNCDKEMAERPTEGNANQGVGQRIQMEQNKRCRTREGEAEEGRGRHRKQIRRYCSAQSGRPSERSAASQEDQNRQKERKDGITIASILEEKFKFDEITAPIIDAGTNGEDCGCRAFAVALA